MTVTAIDLRSEVVDVSVFDDHALIAQTLALSLRRHGVNARVVTGQALREARVDVTHYAARLVLLDLDLSGFSGIELIEPLQAAGCRVVLLSGVEDRLRLAEAVERGAEGIISKRSSSDATIAVVLACLAGDTPMSAAARHDLVEELRLHRVCEEQRLRPFAELTAREAEVLRALADGMAVAQIAAARGVSLKTVQTQVAAVLQKLGVHSQIAAVGMARQAGWLRRQANMPNERGVTLVS